MNTLAMPLTPEQRQAWDEEIEKGVINAFRNLESVTKEKPLSTPIEKQSKDLNSPTKSSPDSPEKTLNS